MVHGQFAIIVHGGAGKMFRPLEESEKLLYEQGLSKALQSGMAILQAGGSALDAAEAAVNVLEDDPMFNAGCGAVLNCEGTIELEASIMDGASRRSGACSGLKTIKNPISLARKVLKYSPHVYLIGEGAEAFADEVEVKYGQTVEREDEDYFITAKRREQYMIAKSTETIALDHSINVPFSPKHADEMERKATAKAGDLGSSNGTVGCVALDMFGNVAAATSTGGMTNKRKGRVGDSPLIGCGTYANNKTCAVSCTGVGEEFIRACAAHTVSCLIEYGGKTLSEATDILIKDVLPDNIGGCIAVSPSGEICMKYNSDRMFRGAADSSGRFEVFADGVPNHLEVVAPSPIS